MCVSMLISTRLTLAEAPISTVPIFLHLQPVLAPLAIPEPPVLIQATSEGTDAAESKDAKDAKNTKDPKKTKDSKENNSKPPKHLYFILTLHDPSHSIRFSTTSQPCPADWLEVEYDQSDWVEERLVGVLTTSVEIIAQDVSVPLS